MRAIALMALAVLTACGGSDTCAPFEMAPNIVQLSFVRVEPPGVLGTCRVTGQIARTFAGDLERGSDLALDLPCTGAALDVLDAARVIELHLDRRMRLFSYAPYETRIRAVHALNEATRTSVTPIITEVCFAQDGTVRL